MTADLCVIGSGPVGLAALFEARLRGLEAFAIDSSTSAVSSIQSHPAGLVYISEGSDWEIAGLPFDRRDPVDYGREDLLHYYSRIIEYGRLELRGGLTCTAMRRGMARRPAQVDVVDARGHRSTFEAKNVLVTNWYQRRAPRASLHEDGSVPIVPSLSDAISAAGKRVVVYGGGYSGFEQATLLMRSGQSVCFAMRSEGHLYHGTEAFAALVQSSRSVIHTGVEVIGTRSSHVIFRKQKRRFEVPADLLVMSIGAEVSPATLSMLQAAQAIAPSNARALATGVVVPEAVQERRAAPKEYMRVAKSLPDLFENLVHGVGGIRVAGGALHIGANGAGVVVSIASARLAVAAMCGDPLPKWLKPPLPVALLKFAETGAFRQSPRLSVLEPLRPLPVRSWTRNWFVNSAGGSFETAAGAISASDRRDPLSFLVERTPDIEAAAQAILPWCDGHSSIGEIAHHNGCVTEQEKLDLIQIMRELWSRNVLTWLPPDRGAPA